MNDILIKNGRVIDPSAGIDQVCDVAVEDGRIAGVGSNLRRRKDTQVIDARGRIVCPGLIDLHVHCREPGHEEEETIATASAAAVAGGFTTILAMPNTHPPVDDETAVNYVLQQGAKADLARVLPVGCITKGREGKELAEMGAMVEAGAVAFSDDGEGIASSSVMHRALQYANMLDVALMQHCQDPDLAGGVMNSGATAVRLGLSGISATGEQIMLRRDLALLERSPARYHVQHVSTAGSVQLIREARSHGMTVSAEATPHHLLLTETACMTYDPNYKMAPPLRTADDVQAVREAVADGTIDCLATDHAPHAAEEKDLEFALAPFGIIGLECALGLYAKALIDTGLMDWPKFIARMTTGPAAVIRGTGFPACETQPGKAVPPKAVPGLGTLAIGAPADITIIDPAANWTVDVNAFASRSRNCPYHGYQLTARAVMTIVGGQVKYKAKRP